ncbi:LLM class flavin-dependent oxidoreductase [Mycobacterium intracellulare]|uniref:LLM class flavin-dependent oxidoreductase n=1 Tax=Mycobacterium intracellulare TaxID=1767 RepID=UPI001EED868F|nr:LLM class flavin-dependent oxidoreductase [Mycobacterium intracellulare]MEE3750859.1 LLM class flavin-dependent oxidoreductase [Mycobacterium intracellulare]
MSNAYPSQPPSPRRANPELRHPFSPAEDPSSPLARVCRQPLMLGLFLPTQTGGFSQSTLPRATRWEFEYNRDLTLQAERFEFDFVFGLQQWTGKGGFGGEMSYRENFLDPFISTVALAPLTERILTISTVHVLYGNWHPLHLARFAATADHIAGGRFGLNIVTGYDAREPLMFGMHRVDHDERYARADEFTAIMEDLWAGVDNLTYDGNWYSLDGAYVSPRPTHGRPIMVSASASPAGFTFAAKHSDIVFTSSPAGPVFDRAIEHLPDQTAQIRAAYHRHGRSPGKTIIFPLVICRETDAEAVAYRDEIVARPDLGSIAAYDARHRDGDALAWPEHVSADRILGGHLQIVGGPVTVADQLEKLHCAGIDGVQIGFYDYEPELAFFAEAVIPLLEARGLRLPRSNS